MSIYDLLNTPSDDLKITVNGLGQVSTTQVTQLSTANIGPTGGIGALGAAGTPGSYLSIGTTNSNLVWNSSPYAYTVNASDINWDTNKKNALNVKGDAEFEGDVKIKGKSIIDLLERLEDRLGVYKANEELESKYEELRELSRRYKELEAEIKDKEKMWNILKK